MHQCAGPKGDQVVANLRGDEPWVTLSPCTWGWKYTNLAVPLSIPTTRSSISPSHAVSISSSTACTAAKIPGAGRCIDLRAVDIQGATLHGESFSLHEAERHRAERSVVGMEGVALVAAARQPNADRCPAAVPAGPRARCRHWLRCRRSSPRWCACPWSRGPRGSVRSIL